MALSINPFTGRIEGPGGAGGPCDVVSPDSDLGTKVGSTFTSTSITALDFTGIADIEVGDLVLLFIVGTNAQATSRTLRLYRDSGGLKQFGVIQNVANTAGHNQWVNQCIPVAIHDGLATSVYAQWSGAVTTGVEFYAVHNIKATNRAS